MNSQVAIKSLLCRIITEQKNGSLNYKVYIIYDNNAPRHMPSEQPSFNLFHVPGHRHSGAEQSG